MYQVLDLRIKVDSRSKEVEGAVVRAMLRNTAANGGAGSCSEQRARCLRDVELMGGEQRAGASPAWRDGDNLKDLEQETRAATQNAADEKQRL